MLQTIPDILARIVAVKREELAAPPPRDLETCAIEAAKHRRPFRKALEGTHPAIIAEVKKASPSRGVLCEVFEPAQIAQQYHAGGAAALSVLTDRQFFQGSFAHLQAARSAVPLPVLRKDFTIADRHVLEAAAAGADAILLIAAILEDAEMVRLRELAESFAMDALVEVHDSEELRRANASGAQLIGVNNRDLRTFAVRLETSFELAPLLPADALGISESGIHSSVDLQRLQSAGFRAFLVGEHLMQSGDPAAALAALRS